MRKSKFTKSQKLEVLAKWDAGAKIDDLCREYQISAATLYCTLPLSPDHSKAEILI
ncbi:transposase [Neolewinella agarilytica]|uniref:Putative transposase n=1 Tax=Neolewinella agarilytica TaxID=478744 RepID=A0A1H9KQV1_9BACT|nr:transposase [Neolewinella agarilytica]SER01307.1 putative transposase [Neolewinella agarilytica]